jgi:hypothetical protein
MLTRYVAPARPAGLGHVQELHDRLVDGAQPVVLVKLGHKHEAWLKDALMTMFMQQG